MVEQEKILKLLLEVPYLRHKGTKVAARKGNKEKGGLKVPLFLLWTNLPEPIYTFKGEF
jgi:hypothetical protein